MTTQDSLTMVSPFFRASMQVTGLSARRVLRIFKALVAFILKSSLSYEMPVAVHGRIHGFGLLGSVVVGDLAAADALAQVLDRGSSSLLMDATKG